MLNKYEHIVNNTAWSLTDSKYTRLSSPNMNEVVSAVHDKHLQLMSDIELGDMWDEQKLDDMEVKIAILRGKLRYLPEAFDMVSHVLQNYKNSGARNDKLKYFTLPYPMVHPAAETSLPRKQLIHSDQIGSKRLFTVWTPITQYQYVPLSGFPYYSFVSKFLPQSMHPFFAKKLERSMDVRMGESVMWGGRYTHAGNTNTSDRLSAALVIRLTEEPVPTEPCRLINDGTAFERDKTTEVSTIKDQIAFCQDALTQARQIPANDSFDETLDQAREFVQNHITVKNNEAGFCLAVLAQRIRDEEVNRDFLQAASTLISSDLLYGIRYFRGKYQTLSKADFLKSIQKHDYLNVVPHDSYQMAKLMGETPSKDTKPY